MSFSRIHKVRPVHGLTGDPGGHVVPHVGLGQGLDHVLVRVTVAHVPEIALSRKAAMQV
jgi:hypothetical protein